MSRFDDALLESGSIMRRGYSLILENTGKLIALIAAAVAILLTFADVGLPSVASAELGIELAVMLAAAYIIYFSLEGAGERLGKSTEAYTAAEEKWRAAAAACGSERIGELREFCIGYAAEELRYRRRCALMAAGLTEEDLLAGESGERPDAKKARTLGRISRMKPIDLTPALLLEGTERTRGELKNPERHKLLRLALGLLPSTLCMLFTVSIIITAKSGLDLGAVISGIVKLSALPMIAMRGYSHGYDYARLRLPAWLETKARLLAAFTSAA